jgi:hypothetical protein
MGPAGTQVPAGPGAIYGNIEHFCDLFVNRPDRHFEQFDDV